MNHMHAAKWNGRCELDVHVSHIWYTIRDEVTSVYTLMDWVSCTFVWSPKARVDLNVALNL